ncbi:MAG: SUMF1/EgtB/PvdO family nonheme iron enzyme [Kofleriaceae bacterium]
MSHLVEGQAPGGTYIRDPARTVTVPRIDEAALVAWFAQRTRPEEPLLAALTIADGWFPVDAHPGDVVRLREPPGMHTIEVEARHGARVVRGPSPNRVVAPLQITLKPDDGTLEVAVQWSAWTHSDGVGHPRFQRMLAELAAAGWTLTKRPEPSSLDWRSWAKQAPVIALPGPVSSPTVADTIWVRRAAARVVLGIDASAREALVTRLVVADREAVDREGTLGWGEYDEPNRRAEISSFLATSLGHAEVSVESFEIMRRPVTNDMWRRYMSTTGAQRPAAWAPSGTPEPSGAVAGISRAEAAAFAAHHGWALPSEAEWQLAAASAVIEPVADGAAEYTSDAFAPYPGADQAAFEQVAAGWQGQVATRGKAPRVPPCIESRQGLAPEHRFKFARFRCVRRSRAR